MALICALRSANAPSSACFAVSSKFPASYFGENFSIAASRCSDLQAKVLGVLRRYSKASRRARRWRMQRRYRNARAGSRQRLGF
jgi:hypothetical protein